MHTVYCLMGPTASGKTGVAIALAQQLPIEVVSVDSALVYREMDIGTAKPSAAECAGVPHHLIDIINPDQTYSVADFYRDTKQHITAIIARGNIPLLVGGTMMYFKALQEGLAELPPADPAFREQLALEAQLKGWPKLHLRLQAIDPVAAERIKPNDKQRLQRALEVFALSGKPLTDLLAQGQQALPFHFENFLLMPADRAWLHQRIAERFQQMMEQNFIQEVQQLIERWPAALNAPSMRMVGYRQALDYLSHGDKNVLQEKAVAATRQLAKRQLTWLRHWDKGVILEPADSTIIPTIQQRLSS